MWLHFSLYFFGSVIKVGSQTSSVLPFHLLKLNLNVFTCALLHEIFATSLFHDFDACIFRESQILRFCEKFYNFNHFDFAVLSNTQFTFHWQIIHWR